MAQTKSEKGGKIKVLSEDVIGKIAAGEVVERPSSVVKELIENAIDAKASRIEIEIKEGGQKLIEIADNGEGMVRKDALLAFTSHATSKITDDSQIESIATLGFRGEALPTIAAVSRITLVTKSDKENVGTQIIIDGGIVSSVENSSHPSGTRIQVRNLFYNVPARLKFLKSAASEMAAISDIVCHYMLGYPEIAFKLTKNGVALASTSGSGKLIEAALAIYGPDTAKALIKLKEPPSLPAAGMSLSGFISMPNQARPSSRYMTTLVNRRVIKSKLLSQAISKAISAFFPRGKYPVIVLDLRMPPDLIDVNVHPQKTEIRFKDERWVFKVMWETVQQSLSGLKMTSLATSEEQGSETLAVAEMTSAAPDTGYEPIQSMFTAPPPISKEAAEAFKPLNKPEPEAKVYALQDKNTEYLGASGVRRPAGFTPVTSLKNPKLLAQLKNSFLLGEDEEGLFIIDQHAAHERILFDKFTQKYQNEPLHSQSLLFPAPLKLLPSERIIVNEKLNELKELGFAIQKDDDGQFYVASAPIPEKFTTESESVQNVLAQVLNDWEGRTIKEIKCDLLKTMACKAAVKAGDRLEPTEADALLNQLLKTENPFTCPHGRPVVIRLTTQQIETGFLRT